MRLSRLSFPLVALLTASALAQAPAPVKPVPTPIPTPIVVEPVVVESKPVADPAPKPKQDAPAPNGSVGTDRTSQDPQPGPTSRPSREPNERPTGPGTGEPAVHETQIKDLPAKAPEELPAGLDPADIAAMKSAQAMLEAETKLKQQLAEGKLGDLDRFLTFEELSSWPYEDGLTGMPAPVRKLDGQKVMMTGFMLPIDEVEGIKEFLLVQSLWACCYGQPPDIHGIVRVVMKGKSRIDYQFDPVKIIGDFKVEAAYEDGYCLDIYQLHADSVEAIR